MQAEPDETVAVPGGFDRGTEVGRLAPPTHAVVTPVDDGVEQAVGAGLSFAQLAVRSGDRAVAQHWINVT